jgi:hypothetical protein
MNIEAVFIDNAMAGGVIDYCELLGHTLTGVDFGGAALEPKRYYNRRAEMAVTATDYIKAGGHIPNDPEFIAEPARTRTRSRTGCSSSSRRTW